MHKWLRKMKDSSMTTPLCISSGLASLRNLRIFTSIKPCLKNLFLLLIIFKHTNLFSLLSYHLIAWPKEPLPRKPVSWYQVQYCINKKWSSYQGLLWNLHSFLIYLIVLILIPSLITQESLYNLPPATLLESM